MVFAAALLIGRAINPNDHTSLLQDFDRTTTKMPESMLIDEADPYFILTGEAEKAMRDSDYHTAVFRLQDAIRVNPDHPSNALLYSNLGIAYNRLDEDSLALRAFDNALKIAPAMTTVRTNRALLEMKMGRESDALSDFSMVIDRDSLNVTARFYRGFMSLYGGAVDVAASDFAVLSSVAPDRYETLLALSSLYSLTGNDAKAIPYYKRLIEMQPAVEYYAALAGCYLATKNLSEAGSVIAEGLAAFGDDPELYFYRAWLKRDSYLIDEAKADARKAVSLGADPARVAALFAK